MGSLMDQVSGFMGGEDNYNDMGNVSGFNVPKKFYYNKPDVIIVVILIILLMIVIYHLYKEVRVIYHLNQLREYGYTEKHYKKIKSRPKRS